MTDSRMRYDRHEYRCAWDHCMSCTAHSPNRTPPCHIYDFVDCDWTPAKGKVYKKQGRGLTRYDKGENNTKQKHLVWQDALESPKKPHTCKYRDCKSYSVWMD